MSRLVAVSGTDVTEPVGDVIFVHGLDGDPRGTWEHKGIPHSFWPEWLATELRAARVWSLDYDASSLAWTGAAMPLVDRATNVLDLCSIHDLGSKPLVFIAHSLGGLLVKQLLRHAKEYNNPVWAPFAVNTRGVVFMATPHSGSDKADWVEAFRRLLRPNATIDDLLAHAPQLRDLNNWYRNNAAAMGIRTKVYCETRKHKGLFLVVDPTSADPGISGVIPIPVDFDHLAICKLQEKDQRYWGILNFVRESLGQTGRHSPISPTRLNAETDILQGLPSRWAAQVDAFRLQYLGTAGNRVPFGGRQKHLQTLTDWLEDESAPQYGLVSARAGLGKSALLVHWMEDLRQRLTDYWLVYFPISARWQTNSEPAIFEGLAFRLSSLFGEPAPRSQDVRELREVLRAYLNRAVDNSQRLLLVLDGLDEAAGWEAGTDLLPPRSRGKVRALLAARPFGNGSPNWLWRLGWNIPGVARTFELDELDQNQVGDVLLQMGDPLASLAARIDVVATVFAKSQGDPLLVGLYVTQLRDQLSKPEPFDERRLLDAEPGLRGFFRYWFEDQERLWGGDRHEREPGLKAMLALCALAHGPLKQEDVRGLNPEIFAGRRSVDKAAQDLQRLIIGNGREQGYVFGHPRLGQFVREDILDEADLSAYSERFLNYGKAAVEQLGRGTTREVPEYVVRWHSTHLTDAGLGSEWFKPLLDIRWCAQWERVDGTPAGFLSDLDKSWRHASAPNELGLRIRIALLRSSILTRQSIDSELFEECVAAHVLSPALAEVMALQHEDAALRCSYLLALAGIGGQNRTRFLREALAAARQISTPYDRAKTLSQMAERLDPGDREQALEEALAAGREIQKVATELMVGIAEQWGTAPAPVLRDVLLAVIENGNEDSLLRSVRLTAERLGAEDGAIVLEEGLTAARQIDGDYFRARALATLAVGLDSDGRHNVLDEALATARQIEEHESRARALGVVAGHLRGDDRQNIFEEALAALQQITDYFACEIALLEIAPRLRPDDRELVDAVLAGVRQSTDAELRARVLCALPESLDPEDRGKLLQEALDVALQIDEDERRSMLLAAVTRHLDSSDRAMLRQAMAAAQQMVDDSDRDGLQSEVVERLDAEDWEALEKALAMAWQFGDENRRARALTEVVLRLNPEHVNLLQRALAMARQIGDQTGRVWALTAIAKRLPGSAKVMVLEEALSTARNIGDDLARADAVTAVAERLGAASREMLRDILGEALAACRQIRDPEMRARKLSAIAKQLDTADREKVLQEALAAARQIGDAGLHARTLSGIAVHFDPGARRSVLEEALGAAADDDRGWGLWGVAECLNADERDLLQQILAAVRPLRADSCAPHVLTALAKRLSRGDRDLLFEILAAVRHGAYYSCEEVLTAVADRLSPEDRDLLQEVLDTTLQVRGYSDYAKALIAIAKRLDANGKAVILREVLKAARADREIHQSGAAETLVEVAEELAAADRDDILQEALAAARELEYDDFQAIALSKIAAHLPPPDRQNAVQESLAAARKASSILREALINIVSTSDLVDCADAVVPFIAHPDTLPSIEHLARRWNDFCDARRRNPADELGEWLGTLSTTARSHLLSALKALVPAIETVGGEAALQEMASAISDVGHWWP